MVSSSSFFSCTGVFLHVNGDDTCPVGTNADNSSHQIIEKGALNLQSPFPHASQTGFIVENRKYQLLQRNGGKGPVQNEKSGKKIYEVHLYVKASLFTQGWTHNISHKDRHYFEESQNLIVFTKFSISHLTSRKCLFIKQRVLVLPDILQY